MKALIAGCVAGLLVLCAAGAGQAADAYAGLYTDAGHSIDHVWGGTPLYSTEVWVWFSTLSVGVQAAEFRLTYDSNLIPSTVTMNPAITASLGNVYDGLSVSFGTCQNGWAWTVRQTIWVPDSQYGEIRLVPRPGVGLQISSCELGFPIYPITPLNPILSVNCSTAVYSHKALLAEVEPIANNMILATFDNYLWYGAEWFLQPSNFRVISVTDPPETLGVTNAGYAEWVPEVGRSAWISLGENLVPFATYIVEARNICMNGSTGSCCVCGCCLSCADSEMPFTFAPVATLLRDFSVEPTAGAVRVSWELGMADAGISYVPLRLERGSTEYEPLTAAVIQERPMAYAFTDNSAASGQTYRYRVDYMSDGERANLFETDWVEAPAARFSLHQNLPNPFNPSTRILFELAEPGRATLAVYDVSGKLVRVLLDEGLTAGEHSAVWDGRTERGEQAASGIYLYRLKAGSVTETKKMVLLR